MQVVSAKTELEIDPIGTPIACRIYLDFKNTSAKTVNGVKFRIGYIDGEEKIRGTFHAPDGHILEPGAQASAKWRGDKVDPRTAYLLIRVLVARYSDGSSWESEKIKDLAPGTGGNNSPSAAAPPDQAAPARGGNAAGSAASEASTAAGPPESDKASDRY